MLSKGSKLNEKKRLNSLPLFDTPKNVRLKFIKVGNLQYISHLDLQRTFNRVITRACIPVWYTKGFNPHAKLVFSTPLSVGAQSNCEYLDIRIDREISFAEIMERLNCELTEELCIIDAYEPVEDFSKIAWSSYNIEICTDNANSNIVEQIKKLLTSSPLYLIKKTKSGEKQIDIIPLINSVAVSFDDATSIIKISCILSASSTEYLNPEMLITALKNNLGLLCGDPTKESYTIIRTGLLKEDMTEFS
ncbi:MAG: DUF2344 domain-containing protein [Clostridia bacterium]|nr:DUF2344 domain-containing protein [Clostridia bacterium]